MAMPTDSKLLRLFLLLWLGRKSHADRLETASLVLLSWLGRKSHADRLETASLVSRCRGCAVCVTARKNSYVSKLPTSFSAVARMALFTRKKSTIPIGYTYENSTRRALPGSRTLDNLIKSQVLYQLS